LTGIRSDASMGNQGPNHGGRGREEVSTETRPRTRTPPRFRVLLHNDDFTSMEFVVDALVRFFHKTATEATRIMLEVHLKGAGVAGVYPRDVAETKAARVTAHAREHGFPLLLTVEEE
jgi:ATP-dependent Clp protease adaptor protein ClpS